jgi:tetratricopeptide (TPR) repeat protein
MANENITNNVSVILEQKRRVILGVVVAVVVIVAALVVGVTISQQVTKKAIATLDGNLIPRYEKLLNLENASQMPAGYDKDTKEALLKDLTEFAGGHSGYAAGKAWSMAGDFYYTDKKWKEAENAYLSSAKVAAKTYIAPISLYDAGAACEEAGDAAGALAHYEAAVAIEGFPYAAHAEFSVGRLYEGQKKLDKAKEAYQAVVDKWPYEDAWTALAQDRLIALATPANTAKAPATVPAQSTPAPKAAPDKPAAGK